MRGQQKNEAQERVVTRLKARGWREGSMFALQVPMYRDRPYVGLPRPWVVRVDRQGKIHRGYPRAG